MSNKYSIGRDPSCFGNLYCNGNLIAKGTGIGIHDDLVALVALANLADAYEAGFRDAAGVKYVD